LAVSIFFEKTQRTFAFYFIEKVVDLQSS
jgi:hypothetical protein